MKKVIYIIFMVIVILLASIYLYSADNNKNKGNINNVHEEVKKEQDVKLNIETTNKFLYYMVKDIVEDRHDVEYMFRNRSNLLSFEFTDDSLDNISKKDLFIYTGGEFEPWGDKFVDELNKNKVVVVNVSRGIMLESYSNTIMYRNKRLKYNPYYWLNIDNYKISLLNIKNAIQDRDPKNRDIYEKNFDEALKKIEPYKKELSKIEDELDKYTFLIDREELEYFVKYTGLNNIQLTKDKDENSKLVENEIEENKQVVLLYNNNKELTTNNEIIKKYKIKILKVVPYIDNASYVDLLKYNIENLNKFLSNNLEIKK